MSAFDGSLFISLFLQPAEATCSLPQLEFLSLLCVVMLNVPSITKADFLFADPSKHISAAKSCFKTIVNNALPSSFESG